MTDYGYDLIVIGASAGGVQALTTIVASLDPDLPAAILIVMHVSPFAVSQLPQILSRAGVLPAAHVVDRERIEPGRLYIAPPNRHLLVQPGRLQLTRGPRENQTRPAVDPLFRSAAASHGSRVIGIVLSGALYDGSTGLLAIKNQGGIAIVQDPNDAVVDSMPRNAMRAVLADFVLPAAEIGARLNDLTSRRAREFGKDDTAVEDGQQRIEVVIANDFADQALDNRKEQTSIYTCPDCGGVLWQEVQGPLTRFRCHAPVFAL